MRARPRHRSSKGVRHGRKLKLILAGEPSYDIIVRWKLLSEQPIGWNPELNDGVQMNIRPFVEAGILRKPPNIKWTKDLSFTHISLLTEVLTVINLAAIFHNTVHLFKLSIESNENTITV